MDTNPRLSRRLFVRGALLGVTTLALAACTTSPTATAPTAAPAKPAETPKPAAPAAPVATTAPATAASPAAQAPAGSAAKPDAAASPQAAAKPGGLDMAALEAAAKKEGQVVWYAGTEPLASDLLSKGFQDKYGIPVQTFRQTNEAIMQKLGAEFQAGKLIADVLVLGDVGAAEDLRKQGRLLEFQPETEALPANYRNPFYSTTTLIAFSTAWNKNQVKDAEVPKTYKDFLDPKWKGRMGMVYLDSLNTKQWYYAMRKLQGVDYLRELGKQQFRFTTTHAELLQQITVGEVILSPMLLIHNALQAQVNQNAPVGASVIEPVIVQSRTIEVLKDAAHPNAAKLFMVYTLSKEGQTLLAEKGRHISARTDVNVPGVPSTGALKTYEMSLEEYADQAKQIDTLDRESRSFFGA